SRSSPVERREAREDCGGARQARAGRAQATDLLRRLRRGYRRKEQPRPTAEDGRKSAGAGRQRASERSREESASRRNRKRRRQRSRAGQAGAREDRRRARRRIPASEGGAEQEHASKAATLRRRHSGS